MWKKITFLEILVFCSDNDRQLQRLSIILTDYCTDSGSVVTFTDIVKNSGLMVCLFHNITLVMCHNGCDHYRVIAAEGAQTAGFPFCEVSTCKITKSHIQRTESHHFSGKIFPVYKAEPRAEVHLVHICLLKCTDCEGFVSRLLL